MKKRLLILLIAGALSLALASPAAAKISVANQNDSGPGSLREAIATAASGETISVPAGTYTLTSEPLLIKGSVNIVGASTGATVIRGNGSFADILIVGPADVELSDLTVREGRVTAGGGAGIYAANADLILDRVAVLDNTIDVDGVSGSPGGSGSGAGVYFAGSSLEISDSTISENKFSSNGGAGKNGGSSAGVGIFAAVNTGRLRISDTTIAGNTAVQQGGQGPPSSEQTGGSAAGVGAYLDINTPSASRFSGVTLSGNTADVTGGPGANNGSATAGGLYVVQNGAPGIYQDMTIAGNRLRGTATAGSATGGGAFIVANQPVYLYDATIAANGIEGTLAAGSIAGNVYMINDVFSKDSIIAGGFGPTVDPNCFASGGTTSLGFNIDSTEQCQFTAPSDRQNTDPQLGPLQDNGGPTQTMLPAITSPAVDQGTEIAATDQRGVGRPIDFPSIANALGGDGSDIGAVELQPTSSLSLAKPKLNKKKGTATVIATVPAPSFGTIALTGKGLKPQSTSVAGQASVTLKLAPAKGLAKALRKKGKAKVSYEVVYSPTGNVSAAKTAGAKLVKSKKKKHPRKNR